MDRKDIVACLLNHVKGINGEFSAAQNAENIRKAFIDANGGDTKINLKKFYRGSEIFALVEELIGAVIEAGIERDGNALFNLVEFRNIGVDDVADFDVTGAGEFVVAEAAAGVRGVRRQKILGGRSVTIDPKPMVIRVYDDLNKFLSGRITADMLVDGIYKAFDKYIAESAYKALAAVTSSTEGLSGTYVKSGSYSDATMLTLIEHVEAATNKKAVIIGTPTALRKMGGSVTTSAELNSDLYNMGYYGKFYGTDCIALKQVHAAGTETFLLANDALWVVAGDIKPVKVVYGGEGMLSERRAEDNEDLTQEYVYITNVGVGVVVNEKFGYFYNMT